MQDEPSIGKGKFVAAKTSSQDYHPTVVSFLTDFHTKPAECFLQFVLLYDFKLCIPTC